LRSGDQIEIITSNKQKPTEDWLKFVVTAKAKTKIKDALREEKRKIADEGKYILQRKMENMGAAYNNHNIEELVQFYKVPSALDLHYHIATKLIDLRELKEATLYGDRIELPKQKPVQPETLADAGGAAKTNAKKDSELIIFGESGDKIMYQLAKCCHPIPGDDVFGFVSTGKGMMIHRTACPNAPQLMANYGHRVVKTKWVKNKEISFLTGLRIIGLDDVGVVNKITNVISGDLRINISGLSIESREGMFEGTIKVFVHDKEELDELVNRLKSLQGIEKVDRLDTESPA
jgi:GTP pyrophosphokinase